MIQSKIKEEMKEAMLAKDELKLSVLRGFVTAFTNELVANGKKPTDDLSDDEAMSVIKRAAKQRKDSISQFEKGGRSDLAEAEKKELSIIETYLPEQMSEDMIREIAVKKKEELDVSDRSKMGILIGAIMNETKGEADGQVVKKIVESLL